MNTINFDAADAQTGEIVEVPTVAERRPTCLILKDDTTYEQWAEIGQWLQTVERSVMWWIGDWVRFGEHRWGEKYAQAIEATGHSYQTIADAKWVASRFEFSRRKENLSFSLHKEVAKLSIDEADRLLDKAARDGWTVRETRAHANRIKNEARLPAACATVEGRKVFDFEALVRNGEKFGTIYADPPWLYDNQGTRAATGNHYGGMTVEELCALPVKDIVDKDAQLHIWTTNGFLFECPKIFEAWGFEFRSSFIWVKPQMGIGNYWRNSHEFLLTAIRGDAKRFNDRSLMSWMQCERGVHSAKPEQVRHFIERASPGPFLEMFARSGSPNWTVWGNQIPGNLLDHGMAEVA